ncbi:MAG: ABC transporter ATP-binding protein [Firmicutes bacterium]|nr:ABC transporter ATP-binding protein [Bacillota bacterium]MDH7495469.1 ABC transporter ATP-binding protein [Bacillota bacterium]
MPEELLQVRDLTTKFFTDDGVVTAADKVSFSVGEGETLGMVGESGCGKSVTSLSIMRLIQSPPGKITSGEIWFQGRDLLQMAQDEIRTIRGNKISMIFQEPMTSLNPVFTIGRQISEAVILHQKVSRREARERAIEMLRLVGIPMPERRIDEYPHQLSGGMRQRAMIAMALSCNPKLLIADEPTTALDVTIQAQILDLMRELKEKAAMSVLLITHDLGVIAEMAQRVLVMYAGQVVEEARCDELFAEPRHPYTAALLRSIPRLEAGKMRLHVIEGSVPNLLELPRGCRFHPRCGAVLDVCRVKTPALSAIDGRKVRCFRMDSPPEAEEVAS